MLANSNHFHDSRLDIIRPLLDLKNLHVSHHIGSASLHLPLGQRLSKHFKDKQSIDFKKIFPNSLFVSRFPFYSWKKKKWKYLEQIIEILWKSTQIAILKV